MKERQPEIESSTTVRQELYKHLMELDPVKEPEEYLDTLEHYEMEELRERQETRRKICIDKNTPLT